ncbi:hypothetical protein HDU88_004782 [Geranomyces variabilis]|nr:hypothetical protein HDU88_004782 [Geranomyces variabilis]
MGRRKSSSSTAKAAAADQSTTDKGAPRVANAAAERAKDPSQGNHVTQQSTVASEQMSFLATLQTESVSNLDHLPYDLMAASAPEDNGGWDALLGALTAAPGTPPGGVLGSVSSEGSSPFSTAPPAHANGPSTSVWPCSPYSSSPEQHAGCDAFANVLREAGGSGAFEHVARTFVGNGQSQPPPRRCVCHAANASSALMTPAPSPVIRPQQHQQQPNGISVDSGVLSLLLSSYIGNLLSPGAPGTVAAALASKQNLFPGTDANRLPWFQEAAGFGYQETGGPPTPPADLTSQHCQQVHRLYHELAPLTSDLRCNTTTPADVARDQSAGWMYDLQGMPNSAGGLLLGSSMSAPSGASSSVAGTQHLSAQHQPRPPQAPPSQAPPSQAPLPLLDLARPGGVADIARLSDSALEQVLSGALLQYQLRSTSRGEGAGGGGGGEGGGARGGGGAGGEQFLAQQLYPHQQRAQEQHH